MKLKNSKRTAYWIFWISFLGGFAIASIAPGIGESLIFNVAFTTLGTLSAFVWIYYDAQIRGACFGMGMRLGVVMLAGIFVPVYIIKTRGWRLGIIKLFKFSCLLIVSSLALAFTIEFLGIAPAAP